MTDLNGHTITFLDPGARRIDYAGKVKAAGAIEVLNANKREIEGVVYDADKVFIESDLYGMTPSERDEYTKNRKYIFTLAYDGITETDHAKYLEKIKKKREAEKKKSAEKSVGIPCELNPGDTFTIGTREFTCLDVFESSFLAIPNKIYGKCKFGFLGAENSDDRIKWIFNREDSPAHFNYELRAVLNLPDPDMYGERVVDFVAFNGDTAFGRLPAFAMAPTVKEIEKYKDLLPEYDCAIWTCTSWTYSAVAPYMRCWEPDGYFVSNEINEKIGYVPIVAFNNLIFKSKKIKNIKRRKI